MGSHLRQITHTHKEFVVTLDLSRLLILDSAKVRSEVYPKMIAHFRLYMLDMPSFLLFQLFIGTSRCNPGDIPWLLDLECSVEEEVGLPMLE